MFERYTVRARRALFFARYEASQCGSVSIESEHLLLGVLREDDGLVAKLVGDVRSDMNAVRSALLHGRNAPVPTSVEIPFSAEVKQALQNAAQEADRLLHNHIGAEHLLLGLLSLEQSRAAVFLRSRGLTLPAVRERLVQLHQSEVEGETRHEPPGFHEDIVSPVRRLSPQSGTRFEATMSLSKRSDGGGGQRGAPGSLSFENTPLEQLIVNLCDCLRERVELPEGMNRNHRYDLLITHSPDLADATRKRLLLTCLETHLNVTVTRETRSADAYVLTAPKGAGSGLKPIAESGVGIGHASMEFVVPTLSDAPGEEDVRAAIRDLPGSKGALQSLSMSGATMSVFAAMLEGILGKPVVDETGLTGFYEVNATSLSHDRQESLRQLLEPLGLVITEANRDVTFVVVRPV